MLNRQGVVIENVDRQNESGRQRRLQEPTGPYQPPGTDGETLNLLTFSFRKEIIECCI